MTLVPGALCRCDTARGHVGLWHEPGESFKCNVQPDRVIMILEVVGVPRGTFVFYVLALVDGQVGYVPVAQLRPAS